MGNGIKGSSDFAQRMAAEEGLCLLLLASPPGLWDRDKVGHGTWVDVWSSGAPVGGLSYKAWALWTPRILLACGQGSPRAHRGSCPRGGSSWSVLRACEKMSCKVGDWGVSEFQP